MVLGEEIGERAGAELFLSLDESDQAEVEVRSDGVDEGADSGDVRHHSRFVVGSAASVEAIAA